MSRSVELVKLSKSYGDAPVVRALSLNVGASEFFTLLGSSGSGKTTTLMMIAGFVEADAGEILIGGAPIVGLPPERRNLGVVFQSYALFPNMSVAENVAFPLRMRKVDRSTRERRAIDILGRVGLKGMETRRVSQLSGGQQQRVALARALVFEPSVLLMDEPLGALDRKLREHLQGEIKAIQQAFGITVIYVTHDQDEALILSDRIAIMADGDLVQVGAAAEVYERPRNSFVAQFLGESNILEGWVRAIEGDRLALSLPNAGKPVCLLTDRKVAMGDKVRFMVRPEALMLGGEVPAQWNRLTGKVAASDYLGMSIRYVLDTPLGAMISRVPCTKSSGGRLNVGTDVVLAWQTENAVVLSD